MNWQTSDLKRTWKSVVKHGMGGGIADAIARWARRRTSVRSDPVSEYQWTLGTCQPAALMPPKAGPLKISWLLPGLGKANGGLLNIFRAIHNLEKWGHQNRVYTLDPNSKTGRDARDLIRDGYFSIEAPVECLGKEVVDSDALVATNWRTAYAARGVPNTAGKFYFVQDLENHFYAEGSLSEFAKETYRWGFHGITLGQWIAGVLQSEFGMLCSPFGFSYDRDVYSSEGRRPRKQKRVLFYARPLSERRGFELGILALSIVASKRPDVQIVLVGAPRSEICVPFPAVLPGVLSPPSLAQLYRSCDIALVLSHTNMSMLPLELMASRCAVVSNRGPNVEWMLTEETTQLSDSTPRSIAESILALLESEALLETKVSAAFAFAQQTDWMLEIAKIEDAFYLGLGLPRTPGPKYPKTREKTAAEATVDPVMPFRHKEHV